MKARTTSEARRLLDLTVAQLSYVLTTRPELEPQRVGNIRIWTDRDIEKVRASLAARPMERTRPVVSGKTSGPPVEG